MMKMCEAALIMVTLGERRSKTNALGPQQAENNHLSLLSYRELDAIN
jgi:hypothetical protein